VQVKVSNKNLKNSARRVKLFKRNKESGWMDGESKREKKRKNTETK